MTGKSRYIGLTMAIAALSPPALALSAPAASRNPAATADAEGSNPVETAHPSRGSVAVGGRTIHYTATPGTLIIRNDDGHPIASVFYTAYVADRRPGEAERPLTFLFNGGPGSASMFLHLGSIAPVRIDFPSGTVMPPAPYRIADNPYTLLDRTDMVFIDMVGAGYSRVVGKAKEADFWSADSDIDAFARAIRRYLTINDRWNSPKYLFGESYGTTRAAGLAYKLSGLGGGGIKLNGIILLGVHLNQGINQPGFEENNIAWLPSYAATAWYHHRLADRPETLEPWLTQVREWTRGPYAAVLMKGHDATDEERRAIARQYSAFTGIAEQEVLDAQLRIEPGTFRKILLRDRGLTLSRLDARLTGQDGSSQGGEPEYDATGSFNAGPFGAGIHHYLSGRLGYSTTLEYRPNIYGRIGNRWDRSHVGPSGARMPLANMAIDLSRAMRENRFLKVLVLSGYYDLATPFFRAEYDIKRMPIDRELQRNIRFEYFGAGHMIYTNTDEMPRFKQALDRFYDEAAAAAAGGPG